MNRWIWPPEESWGPFVSSHGTSNTPAVCRAGGRRLHDQAIELLKQALEEHDPIMNYTVG